MRQCWTRASRPLFVLMVVVVVAGALALAGASAVSSSLVSARPLSGAPALKQAQAAGIDAGAVSEPATTSSPDILAPADLIVGEGDDHVDLTVALSDQSDNPVSVHYATADSTAAAGVCGNSGDYAAVSGHAQLRAGGDDQGRPRADRRLPGGRGVRSLHLQSERSNQRGDRKGEQPDQHRRQRHDRAHAEAVRARCDRRREGRQRARLGAAGRPRRPGLGQHRHRQLRNGKRNRTRRRRLQRRRRHAHLRARRYGQDRCRPHHG